MKVVTFLSNIGGLAKSVFFGMALIVCAYSRIKYKLKVANILYDFRRAFADERPGSGPQPPYRPARGASKRSASRGSTIEADE